MKIISSVRKIALTALLLSLVAVPFIPSITMAASDASTLANLQAAFNGESNAGAKYLAYAKKADQEGYYRVGKLFRAASKAESIHAQNHAEVIRSMGAEPKADIKAAEVKSTRENLQDAINGETYEQKEMYPAFLKQAAADNNADADQTFTYAREAEIEHARLYKLALDNLDEWKTSETQFNVCPTCGFTVEGKPAFADCPTCAESTKKFLSVS